MVGRLEDIPTAWIEEIRAGRCNLESVSHPVLAFAEALRHEVSDRLRPTFGLARQESIAVVFADRSFEADLASFAEAMRAHAPAVGVWSVEGGRARRVAEETLPKATPDAITDGGSPTLRLAGTEAEPPREEPPPRAPATDSPAASDASVTPEEIEMLLSFFDADPDEPSDTGPGVRR